MPTTRAGTSQNRSLKSEVNRDWGLKSVTHKLKRQCESREEP
jgi:hypothetical protein